MPEQKLTTEEILAQARREGAFGSGGGGGGSTAPNAEPESAAPSEAPDVETSESAPVETAETASTEAPVKKPVPKPGTTSDILAAARAQGSKGAGGKTAPDPKPAAKPGSTSDILAAARAQGTGGGSPRKPAAKPGSTADILAAARAGTSGGGAAKAPTKQVTEKASPKQPATARPAGDRPSVQEMVKAAREGAPAASQAAPTKPKLPTRPPLPVRKPDDALPRRSFIGSAIIWITEPFMAAWVAMGAIAAIWGLATARFMMPNMIVEPTTRFKIGPPSEYPPGTVSAKWKAERGIWVVNTDQYDGRSIVYALASVCTHLGCTPNWLEGEQKFKCPCHGSGFYITGINFEGPAPRPLERVGLKLAEDGSLEVDKSVKFQEELGQWQDEASFVELA